MKAVNNSSQMKGIPASKTSGAKWVDLLRASVEQFNAYRAEHPDELDEKILQMIDSPKPVIFDCRVTKEENCFPMIVSGKAHNEMTMADEATDLGSLVSEAGKRLV